MTRRRRRLALLLGLSLTCAGAPTALAAPHPSGCTPAPSTDALQPPCNPALAQSPWAASHAGSYAQASSALPGPRPGQQVVHQQTRVRGVPVTLVFSEPYPDGRRVVWGSVVSAPESEGVFKLDERTGELLHSLSAPTGQTTSGTSGAYSVLDRDGRFIVAHRRALDVYEDGGTRTSPIRRSVSLDLSHVLCRADDRVVGITMRHDGTVAFASELGVVGVVPRTRMTRSAVRVLSLNGPRCADTSVPRDELEQVSNSIAADERGGVYVVTSRAQYKFADAPRRRGLVQVWRTVYATGGTGGGARLGTGSGSTPTLMGTRPDDDRFVVITDGRDLMHLVLLWRDAIPADWRPLAPGKDRRIACEVPVTFGDAGRTESVSEQSVLVRGHAAVVVDNAHALDPVYAAAPAPARPFTVLADQVDQNAPRGLERIDWDPRSRTCRSVWANPDVSMPNGIPALSAATGLVYDVGRRAGSWGLVGVDLATGRERLWVPSTVDPTGNSFFAATEIGPGGAVWSGTFQGVSAFRPRSAR